MNTHNWETVGAGFLSIPNWYDEVVDRYEINGIVAYCCKRPNMGIVSDFVDKISGENWSIKVFHAWALFGNIGRQVSIQPVPVSDEQVPDFIKESFTVTIYRPDHTEFDSHAIPDNLRHFLPYISRALILLEPKEVGMRSPLLPLNVNR